MKVFEEYFNAFKENVSHKLQMCLCVIIETNVRKYYHPHFHKNLHSWVENAVARAQLTFQMLTVLQKYQSTVNENNAVNRYIYYFVKKCLDMGSDFFLVIYFNAIVS